MHKKGILGEGQEPHIGFASGSAFCEALAQRAAKYLKAALSGAYN